jgi:hypothetical protein
MVYKILYRNNIDWRQEENFAKKYFSCISSRTLVESGDLIIPRFSAYPFYKELEDDVKLSGGNLINSYNEHQYIADLGNWIWDLYEFTPKTWNKLEDLPEEGPFFLKGETNSKKYNFNTHCYAKNKREAIEVHGRLCDDSLISCQKIYIREYIPLVKYMDGLQGLPITKEFRFFCYKDKILSGGYYWSSHIDEIKEKNYSIDPSEVPLDFLNKLTNIIKYNATFYVIDVAQTQNGNWILIELNDGSQSGLSENNPDILYKNLFEILLYKDEELE